MTSLREALERTGYSVGRYYSHAPGGFSYDYSCPGKGPMNHQHFKTEDEAWAAAEKNLAREIKRAQELIAAQALADNPVDAESRASPTREQIDWLPIETCPIGEKVEVIWFEDGDFEGPEAISMCESRNEFWNLNSGNLNHRIPDQPHTWPSHWRYISREGLPPPPTSSLPIALQVKE